MNPLLLLGIFFTGIGVFQEAKKQKTEEIPLKQTPNSPQILAQVPEDIEKPDYAEGAPSKTLDINKDSTDSFNE